MPVRYGNGTLVNWISYSTPESCRRPSCAAGQRDLVWAMRWMPQWLKRLFHRQPHYRIVQCETHSEAKAAVLRGSVLAIVGSYPTSAKWAYLNCPCGCGEALALNLMRSHRPQWELRVGSRKRPTLHPSVSSTTCGAHFWLQDGAINWAEPPPRPSRAADLRRHDPTDQRPNRSTPLSG
jgi:hypothetical protein